MAIIVTAHELPGSPSQEEFPDLEALAAELDTSASPVYAAEVLRRLRAGERLFDMQNGENSFETYELRED